MSRIAETRTSFRMGSKIKGKKRKVSVFWTVESFLLKKFIIMAVLTSLRCLRWALDTFPRLLLNLWHRNENKQKIPPINDPLLLESVSSLAAYIRQGKLKSTQLIKAYIHRIREVQPFLNAMVDERFQDALKEAQAVDEFVASGKMTEEEMAIKKPLLGIPFSAKDSFAINGMLQTAGLVARKNYRASEDAEPVILLKEAGAIPFVLTNVPELILWYDSNNKLHGRTNNPYNFTRIPGGSSGGEGSLIAAAGSIFGLGSDVGGSIRIPSFYCGIYGHKPSPGIVPCEGQFPAAKREALKESLGIGPMCRYASDLRLTFKVLAGSKAESLRLDEKVDLSKLRIYYMEDDGGFPLASPVHPDVRKGLRKVLRYFEQAYGIHPKKVSLPQMKNSFFIWGYRITLDSGDQGLSTVMANEKGDVNLFLELVKKVLWLSPHTLPVIINAILQKVNKSRRNHPHVLKMLRLGSELRQEFLELLKDDAVFIYPGNPEPAVYHEETLIKGFVVGYTGIFNVLGLPVTACPTGLSSDGLPVGIQVVAGPNQDRLTLAVAEELEQKLGGWISPCRKPAQRWNPESHTNCC